MTTGYQIKDQYAAHYLTFQVVEWADIFTRKIYRDIIMDSFKYCCKNKGLEIYAFVIMSNHIHLIVKSKPGKLSGTIRDLKSYTSRKIIETIFAIGESRKTWLLMVFKYAANGHNRNEFYQVWTHENHAIELYSKSFIEQKINYIHQNPVKAGLVAKAEDYLYSSAGFYAGLPGAFEIEVLSLGWKTII
jgi:REP element-mobilizing transposase RayT